MQYQRDEHRVHRIVYHFVWTPKRRKPILQGPVAEDCNRLIREVCATHGWNILELAIQPDHIHLLVQVWPIDSPHNVMKAIKGTTSRYIRANYPDIKRKLPSLWTRSYFCTTVGSVEQEAVQQYIRSQATL